MAVDLPTVLTTYVAAKNSHDVEGQLACFAPDAVVHDDGEQLRGTDEIRPWVERTTAAYDLTVEPVGFTEGGDGEDGSVMTALVSGTFPGSPIEFRYHVTIGRDRLTALRIEA